MPVQVKGALDLQKALRKFTPDLAKETRAELAAVLKPVVVKARGFVPSRAPLSGWAKATTNGKFPTYNGRAAKGGIGYKTTPSQTNAQGFRSLARIKNSSASGAIYETAGRTNPSGSSASRSRNPQAGKQFIDAIDSNSSIADAGTQRGGGSRSRSMKGRAIFRAWQQDGGNTSLAVVKAIQISRDKFNKAVGYN